MTTLPKSGERAKLGDRGDLRIGVAIDADMAGADRGAANHRRAFARR